MNAQANIKVLVVEDSRGARMSLVHFLNSDPRIAVIGMARNGREALQFLSRRRPDVILMDIQTPRLNGLDATRHIMETQPVPIVICSGDASPCESTMAFKLLEAGAVALVEKPLDTCPGHFQAPINHLVQTVKLMSEVKVVHRWPRTRRNALEAPIFSPAPPVSARNGIDFIGIGASTGGPPVLKTILETLPGDFPVPLLIVQHIASGFLDGLVDWLRTTTGIQVQIAEHGIFPSPGHAYLAPDEFHMAVNSGGQIILSRDKPCDGLRPSVSRLFYSLAEVCGTNAVGVLLTGMGKDGALELKRMRDNGATTIAQDRKTSAVHGMPGEAIALGGATWVLSADQIAPALMTLIHQQHCEQGVLS